MHVRTWQAAYTHVFGAERLEGMDVEARTLRWRRWIEAGEVAHVADDEGRIVGFVWVGPSRDPDADGELYAIYVLPEAWGSGTGPALMRAGIDAMRDAGYREPVLWVLEDNPRARRFYEREGWELDGGRKEDEFLGVRVAEVRYRVRL
ncbi:MAG TPA: GNAT family N-acetyltransferase [Gaiellaceae bacterium]|nr:GNAT family N-acetyltransferase [Gaiellaceae bacterium]